ncbi:DNA topoisomerase 3-alpha-like [Lingula anatina]|uniref:DNA topoisomerase n=1 Tax=Lingula anatina TaxID=7574 RepID=A0A1S3K1C6_LINAN|nr:DNA topoisomerase 3-alpha-like [Lingula anatina]|eukprot:XP_013416438.1 DNA topoisomerase 3-alpha-like [Lingula anatina]
MLFHYVKWLQRNHVNISVKRVASVSTKMVRVLSVAEKNDAAKSLAEILSRGRYRRREGLSRFNKLYEFETNILNMNCTMTMTSVSGHLMNFDFTGQYKKWQSCTPQSLFDAPVEKCCPENFVDIKRTLEKEVRGCNTLIIWTDGDREGENIGFEIINVCRQAKPNIRVLRARFSEITPQAITRACQNLMEPDQNVSDAVDVRQELDLRIGAAFTRFQTLRLQKIFPGVLGEQLISYGSCQFPTLGFVVERYKQVQQFVSEAFWKIQVTHKVQDGAAEFSWKRVRLFDHTACLVLYQHCMESPTARVEEVKTKPKSKWRPNPLDTVELEKLASRKLRINAKETMKIAEKLYTSGFISYPRTETNMFPKDMDLRGLVEKQTQSPHWGGFAGQIMERGPTPRNGNKTDNAHPPIHPTKYTNSLQGNEAKLYEYIVRHFLACCSQDAQGMETTVQIDIAEEKFVASGLMIIAKNYLDVYIYDKWNAKVIPVFNQGETFQPTSIQMVDGETSPPLLLSEADLIALMEKHGIGTDATHAEHIETIKSRNYVGVRNDGRFVPGELGMGLVEGYDSMGYEMSKPHLRAELEADLKRICEGKKDKDVVLREQIQKYKEVFIEACRQASKIDEALSHYLHEEAQPYTEQEAPHEVSVPVLQCPGCSTDMLIKRKKDGQGLFLSCMGYPECRNAMWFPDAVLEATVTDEICDKCLPGPVHKIKFKFKRGSVPPTMLTEYVGCVGGCDDDLTQGMNMHFTGNSRLKQSQRSVRSNDSGYGSSFQSTPRNSTLNSQGNQGLSRSGNSTNTNDRKRNFSSCAAPVSSSTTGRFNGASVIGGRNGFPMPAGTSPQTGIPARMPLDPITPAQGNATVCNCGSDAMLLTVRKEGPNTGRQFFKCPLPQGSGCDFFLWADQLSDPQLRQSPNAINGSSLPLSSPHARHVEDGVKCNCHQAAKQLTVQKEGPNKGRQFYACPKPRGEGCAFFQWGDAVASTFNSHSLAPSQQSSAYSAGDGEVQCRCHQSAKQLTVHKEGPNKGRPFYACPKPRGEGCGFFQWADEEPDSMLSSNAGDHFGNGARKRNSNTNRQPGEKKSRKCGLCGEEGHTRRNCPHA